MEKINSEDEHVLKVLNLIQDWHADITTKQKTPKNKNFYEISKGGKTIST